MAIKKIVELFIDTKKGVENVENLENSIDNLGKTSQKEIGKTSEAIGSIDKSGDKAKKGLNKVSNGFKAIGTAIKAAGIGLIITLFAALTEVLRNNQKVMDTVASISTTISLAFNAVTDAISNAYKSVSDATNGFESLKKVASGLLTLVLTPLKLQFYGIKSGVIALQLAWEKSFLGKGRPEKIDELQSALDETEKKILDTTLEAGKAAKDISDNYKGAINEVGGLGKAIVEETGKVSVSNLKAQADAIVELRNQAKIAESINKGLLEDYDRQAELQRQIRDDVNKSISERQEANTKLNSILLEQEKAMIKNADLVIQSARNELAVNNNIDNQVALQEALNEKKAVLATIEGKRSEQLVNETALVNELNQMNQTAAEGEITREIERRNFETERIRVEEERLQKQRENIEVDKELELGRLQTIIDSTVAGTQARVDAEQAYQDAKQQFELDAIVKDDEIKELQRTKQLERNAFELENQLLNYEERRALELQQRELLLQDETLSETKRAQMKEKFARDDVAREQLLKKQKLQVIGQTLGAVTELLGKNSAAGKAAGIAQAVINTYQGITEVWKTPSTLPEPFATISRVASTATVLASGISAVKSIKSTKLPQGASEVGGGSISASSIPSAPTLSQATPSFSVVGQSETNQLAQTIGQRQQEPIKAYVVSTEVTTQQSLDRNVISTASFG